MTGGAVIRPGLMIAAMVMAVMAAGATPATADTVAYVDGNDLWLASPDGAHRLQVTSDGTATAPYSFPAQGRDGKTVVAHLTQSEGTRRPTLQLYGADAHLRTSHAMPSYSGATNPVYPIGLDIDWNSDAVAYGYSYCAADCATVHRGYWLTFSDRPGPYPSNPQGQSDAHFPTFYGRRVVSSDSGGSIFVQPDDSEAPFTHGYQEWLSSETRFYSRAEVSPAGNMFGVEWSDDGDRAGITVGRHHGVPGTVSGLCELPVAERPANVTFSPDGRHLAWSDAEGLKVAGVPNLDAGTVTCTLSSPPVLISATAKMPSFGGGDVAAILEARKPPVQDGGGQVPGDSGQTSGDSGQAAGAFSSAPGASGPLALGPPPFPAKLEIARASVLRSERRLSVLAPITGRASGHVQAAFQAAGRTERFDAEVDPANRRVRVNRAIPSSQARLGTGILTLTYGGDEDTQPQEVRLRAASQPARLDAQRPKIVSGRLTASGEITKRARGVVRLQLLYEPPGEPTRTLEFTAPIRNGHYVFDERLPENVIAGLAQRRGVVHSYTLFTGYFERRVRGEMKSYQVLGER